ncbi:MAG: sensor histidine kinase [Clostridia bacterium]|jgi:PAS domain S-box-containing protein
MSKIRLLVARSSGKTAVLENSAEGSIGLEKIMQATRTATWEWNIRTGEIKTNGVWPEMLGFFNDSLRPSSIETWKSLTHAIDMEQLEQSIADHLDGTKPDCRCEVRMRHKDGYCVWILIKGQVVHWTAEGDPLLMVGTQNDISEQKTSEGKMAALSGEKDLLLREVHHRIKNNMNTISSLLSLQASRIGHQEASMALKEAQGRIRSMSILYDKLYKSDNYNDIPVHNHLTALVSEVVKTMPDAGRIQVTTRIDDFTLAAGTIQSVSLIMNELLTNSLKYAFQGRPTGRIEISASLEDDRVVIIVQDDGNGVPATTETDLQTGFGYLLIRSLCTQLDGTLTIESAVPPSAGSTGGSGPGTRVCMAFNKQEKP